MSARDRVHVHKYDEANIISLAAIRGARERYTNLVTTTTVLIGNFRNDLLWAAEGLAVNGPWRLAFLSHPAGVPFEYHPDDLHALASQDVAVRAVMRARRDLGRALKDLHRAQEKRR